MKEPKNVEPIPSTVITELLGQSGLGPEVSNHIAGIEFKSMATLIATIEGQIVSDSNRVAFKKHTQKLGSSKFYAEYFRTNP